jgi:acyl-CoA reductase-like NAD-dependent aldehyde dehydrogenase
VYIAGEWRSDGPQDEVVHPYSGEPVATVRRATVADVDRALAAAVHGARAMQEGPEYAIEEMTETKTVIFHGVGGGA